MAYGGGMDVDRYLARIGFAGPVGFGGDVYIDGSAANIGDAICICTGFIQIAVAPRSAISSRNASTCCGEA